MNIVVTKPVAIPHIFVACLIGTYLTALWFPRKYPVRLTPVWGKKAILKGPVWRYLDFESVSV